MPVVIERPITAKPPLSESASGIVPELESLLREASRGLLAFAAKLMVLEGSASAAQPGHVRTELPELLAELTAYCDDHFRQEEAILRSAGLAIFDRLWEAHTSAHAELMRGFSAAADDVVQDSAPQLVGRVVSLIGQFWSVRHIEHDRLACDVLGRHLSAPTFTA